MSVLCPTNLMLPLQPQAYFLKITILALVATILMFSNRICIFTLIVVTIYHFGITTPKKEFFSNLRKT